MPANRLGAVLAGAGVAALGVSAALRPAGARAAAAQDWSPFVLVSGLLLIGLVADDDGLFANAGHRLARAAPRGAVLFVGAAATIAAVTAVLNLDTSVAFLTPVLVYTARSRGGGEAPLLYGCLMLSNAGSLLLPGSNLTNLIVLGHLHLTGGEFLSRMWLPSLAAVVLTALAVALVERAELRGSAAAAFPPARPVLGVGLAAVVAASALVIVLRSPALPVAGVGVAAVALHVLRRGRAEIRRAYAVLGAPLLVGLFGLAVALGTLGRAWDGPARLLGHLDLVATAVVAGVATVLVNNLPAASLLAARQPPHPYALLVGLNLGPNLFVTGSLAWLLWLRAARGAGARPSIARAARIGLVATPLSVAAAVLALLLSGTR